jgi:hypothetical protein
MASILAVRDEPEKWRDLDLLLAEIAVGEWLAALRQVSNCE